MIRRRARWQQRLMLVAVAVGLAAVASVATAQRNDGRDSRSVLKSPTLPERPEGPVDQYYLPGSPDIDPDLGDGVRITSDFPIRTVNNIGVVEGRSKIEYRDVILEADRMRIDYLGGDIDAVGNAVLTGTQSIIKGDRFIFNLNSSEGVSFGADGQNSMMFFRAVWDEKENGASFTQIDEVQSVYRGTHFTHSNWPVPMTYIKAQEVILLQGKRIYFRNPVLHVRGVPVFWLPFYSRSFDPGSPWFFIAGYDTELGPYLRAGYRFIHETKVPDWTKPGLMTERSRGEAEVMADFFGDRAMGAGLTYKYQFEFHRHLGTIELYGVRDDDRKVYEVGEIVERDENLVETKTPYRTRDDESGDRWAYRHRHNSRLLGDLYFQMDVDEVSDPDVFVDFYDRFAPTTEDERGRMFERGKRGAMTWIDQDWVLRIMGERADRLGRDRFYDPANHYANDLDYDPVPFIFEDDDFDPEGIPADRFGMVRERVMGRFGTRLLRMSAVPLFYRLEANAFDSLDPGLNGLSERDDARVRGGDVYGSITHRLRLGERTTWMNTVGAGAADYSRNSDELIDRQELITRGQAELLPGEGRLEPVTYPDGTTAWVPADYSSRPHFIDDTKFNNERTIVPNLDGTPRSLDDVDDQYAFADVNSRLNHRFTDFLDGMVEWDYRRGNDDSLGEFYEQIGSGAQARHDIYPFYTNYHWISSRLNYFLRYPNIFFTVTGGQNLESDDEIYANERARYASTSVTYTNDSQELVVTTGILYDERQIRDPASEYQYRQGFWGPFGSISYYPRHARYWASLTASTHLTTEEDPAEVARRRDVRERRRYDEETDEALISPLIGRRLGPKYRVQVSGTYTTRYRWWDRAGVTLIRDMHDAELGISVGVRSRSFEDRRDDEDLREDEDLDVDYELDIQGSIRIKVNRDNPGMGSRSLTTLKDLRREGQFVR